MTISGIYIHPPTSSFAAEVTRLFHKSSLATHLSTSMSGTLNIVLSECSDLEAVSDIALRSARSGEALLPVTQTGAAFLVGPLQHAGLGPCWECLVARYEVLPPTATSRYDRLSRLIGVLESELQGPAQSDTLDMVNLMGSVVRVDRWSQSVSVHSLKTVTGCALCKVTYELQFRGGGPSVSSLIG